MSKRRIIVAGGRDFGDYFAVQLALERVAGVGDEIVSGGAAGADKLGERYASEQDHPLKVFPANWETNGRAAGPMRNSVMAEYADTLVAFWDGQSRGTKDMIRKALNGGLEVHVYRYSPALGVQK